MSSIGFLGRSNVFYLPAAQRHIPNFSAYVEICCGPFTIKVEGITH